MKEQTLNRAKLGAFVLIATTFLIIGLYFIGSKKNIFHSSISVSANFSNIGGLIQGNNVRFNGINVGVVSNVYPIADTAIKVEFTIDQSSTKYISSDATVSIGTDGLLGNKLVNISPGKKKSKQIEEGNLLISTRPIQIDSELRTITTTNNNLKVITDNLKGVSEKLNNNNSLWQLLTDTRVADNIRKAIVTFKLTGENTAVITGNLSKFVTDIKAGKGTIGALLTDTSISEKLSQTIININSISDTMAIISGDFKTFSKKLNNKNSTLSTLLSDTAFVHNLNSSIINIKDGADNFNKNMEALKHSWPLKKYFKQQKKSKQN